MKQIIKLTVACIVLVAPVRQVQAGLIVYADRLSFNADNPGLPIEDFSEAIIGPNDVIVFDGPLSSTTPRPPAFPTGLAQPGIVLDSASGLGVISPGFFGHTNGNMVLTQSQVDPFDLFFPNGDVFAVAADLGSLILTSNIFDISVFGPGDSLIGSTTAVAKATGTGFFGVASDNFGEPITRIRLSDQGNKGVTNVAFGSSTVAPVPEPSSLAIFGLVVCFLGGSALRRRRQRIAAEKCVL